MGAKKKASAKTDEQHACPHCGYCPHCGRNDRPAPMIPAPHPLPVPARPYQRPYWYGEPTIRAWGSNTGTPRFHGGSISINCGNTC